MKNIYFSDRVKSEQDLYEDLIIESLKTYGQDLYYIPREVVNIDTILYDDIPSKFSSAYKIEMYIENVDGFAGENELFQKFGVEIRDQATFIVARRRWQQTVSQYNNDISGDLPREGDLVYVPLTQSLFEIMHVERENPFYQLSNLPTVRLNCELFEYNDERMDTKVPEIDRVETLGYTLFLTLDADSDDTAITVGDTITETLSDGTEITAEVIEWDRDTQILTVSHVGTSDGKFHIFTAGSQVTFSKTGASRFISSVSEDLGDHVYQNEAFDSDVDQWLSFDESNPFGDPTT